MEAVDVFNENQTFIDHFEENIPDDAMVVKVKLNDINEQDEHSLFSFINAKNFVEDCFGTILFSSCGLHLKGRNKIPHYHFHAILKSFKPPSNMTVKKNGWIAKDPTERQMPNSSIQITPINHSMPKYHVLTYPLKEGTMPNHYEDVDDDLVSRVFIDYTVKNKRMAKKYMDFLLSVGNEIYQTELAANHRREKCEQRKKDKLNELFDLCDANKDKFYDFPSMLIWLDEYIFELPLNEKPDIRNFRSNAEKVANKLRMLKYSDVILGKTKY